MPVPFLPALDTWVQVPASIPTSALWPPCVAANPDPGWAQIKSMIDPWVSFAWDESRQQWNCLIGGGHGDFRGNWSIAWDVNTATWIKLDDNSTHGPANELPEYTYVSDGIYPVGGTFAPGNVVATGWSDVPKPVSRHTYDGVTWVPSVDRGVVMGGVLANASATGEEHYAAIWNPTTKTWARGANAAPGLTNFKLLGQCDYDPVSGKVILRTYRQVYSYDVATATWVELLHSSPWFANGFYGTMLYCPADDAFWAFGGSYSQGDVPANGYAVRAVTRPSYSETLITAVTGDTSLLMDTANDTHTLVGRCWHAGLQKFVFWYGGAALQLFDPLTRVVTTQTLGGTPPPSKATLTVPNTGFTDGLFKRLRYSVANDLLMLMYNGDAPIYYARLSGSLPAPSGPGALVFASNPVSFH